MVSAQAQAPGLSPLKADLLLAHAPAVFEFRGCRDRYYPFLGTSGDVPITPLYEYFPVGFKTLQRYLGDRGHDVALINLATLFTRYRDLPLETVLEALDVKLLGIDLHWMIHVQGSLAIAERVRAIRPDLPIIFGGISSTYYAQELIRYPFIDYVMRGYDTHAPMDQLLRALQGGTRLDAVPNLLWKDGTTIRDNGMAHLPNSFACGIDWSTAPEAPPRRSLPIREVLSTQNAGCAYNCPWCGGSRDAFRRIFGRRKAMARKPREEVAYELRSAKALAEGDRYHFYSVGAYNESKSSMLALLDDVSEAPFRSVSYEQFYLTPEPVLRKMVEANRFTTITLSPESHDPKVARAAGRGVYTNDEMVAWIDRALELGIHGVDIWYFVGMPHQDERSVMETVDFAETLLRRYPKQRVNPMICPMIPLLDPGSNIFEAPETYGYRVFYRTAEEHRRGLERASLLNRINYETRWLSRRDLVRVGFDAVKRLMQAKQSVGQLPRSMVGRFCRDVDDAWTMIEAVHEADSLPADQRGAALDALGDDIALRNESIFFGGVANQAFPLRREVGGRWFDTLGFPVAELEPFARTRS